MAYRSIDLATILNRRYRLRRLAVLVAFAVAAGLLIGTTLRAASAGNDATHQDEQAARAGSSAPCPRGHYADFWSGDIRAQTASNAKLPADLAKQFIQRLNASKAVDGKAVPVEGTTIRLLVHKDTNRRFGLAINKAGCVVAFGYIEEDFLAYLLGKGPMPARYQLPGERI